MFIVLVMVVFLFLYFDIIFIGVIIFIFLFCYGCSKFVSGVVGDMLSLSLMFGGGLIVIGFVNIVFGVSLIFFFFCVFWVMNGILQGFGALSCAKILIFWFVVSERGIYWGMWNIVYNFGGFMVFILVGIVVCMFGWNWGLWVFGCIVVVVGVIIVSTLKDFLEDKGFELVEIDVSIVGGFKVDVVDILK